MKVSVLTVFLLVVAFAANAAPTLKVSLSSSDDRYSCQSFKGVLAPSSDEDPDYLELNISLSESSEKPEFSVVYTNNGYARLGLDSYTSYKTNKSNLKIPYYKIRDDRHFAINQVYVSAKLDNGDVVSAMYKFRVLRSLVLEKAPEDVNDCFTMFKAEKLTGPLTNTSTQPRSVTISDRVGKSRYFSEGRSKGWTFKFSLFNILGIDKNVGYVSNLVKGVDRSTEVQVTTTISPEEALILTRQATLFRDAYTVYNVDNCGNMENAGVAYYNYWLITYPVARLDMASDSPFSDLDIGYDDQQNTCEETDGSDDDDIFVPDSSSNQTFDVQIEDPETFNDVGREVNAAGSKEESKNIFKRMFRTIFKRK